MRIFIALELPTKIKDQLAKVQKELTKTDLPAKWLKPKNIHLTLAFLGSIKPEKIETISKILTEAAFQTKPIRLRLLKLNFFPSSAKTRVLFVDLGGELNKVHLLALKIKTELKKEKIWVDKKPFRPHLTLARVKKQPNLAKIIKKTKIKQSKFLTDQIVLVKSQLSPAGPVYTHLKTFPLLLS